MPIIVNDTMLAVPGEVELIPDSITQAGGPTVGQGVTFLDFQILPGIPLYLIILLGCFLLLATAALWYPVKAKTVSAIAKYRNVGAPVPVGVSVCGWILNQDLTLSVEPVTLSSNVLSFQDSNPRDKSTWLMSGKSSSVIIGGKPGFVVSPGYSVVRNLVAETALMECIRKYNERFKDNPKAQILSFSDWQAFGRRNLMTIYPSGLISLGYRIMRPNEIDRFLPKHIGARMMGDWIYQEAKTLVDDGGEQEGFWSRNLPIMLLAGIGMIMVVAAWLFPL